MFRLINSFPSDSDSTLGAGEYSFLIYNSQSLILYNIDGPLHKQTWNTLQNDSIQQIRWSSYHRAYLILTARMFYIFFLSNYRLLPWQQLDYALQLFTCHETNLWLICLSSLKQQQFFFLFDLSQWDRGENRGKHFPIDQLGLHRTDTIVAIENHPNGSILGLLIAERNRTFLSMGIQRRRRLILTSTNDLLPIRTIYFHDDDDLFWTMTYIPNGMRGWLLTKWFDRQMTFVDDQTYSIFNHRDYPKEIRNLAMTIDGNYLVIRTVDSLDIYQIYFDQRTVS